MERGIEGRMRAALLLILLALIPLGAAQEEGEDFFMLHMQDYEYLPASLEVPAGAQMYAMNFGQEPHTVTSSTDRALFDVQNIQPGGAPYPFTAPGVPGEYPFYCVYHGNAQGEGMAGKLVVVAAAASPSPTTSPTPAPAASPTPAEKNDAPAPGMAALAPLLAGLALARRK